MQLQLSRFKSSNVLTLPGLWDVALSWSWMYTKGEMVSWPHEHQLCFVVTNSEHSSAMSRPSVVPSIDEFRLPKFEFEPWSTRSSVYSRGTYEDEKALINFRTCVSESAEDWSSVGLPTHRLNISLTYHKGQEVVCRQHMLPCCAQLSHCLFASRWSRLLYSRLF